MGYYFQTPESDNKAAFLIEQEGAILLRGVEEARSAYAEGFGVVCVVDNGPFEAAGFAFSESELEVFACS